MPVDLSHRYAYSWDNFSKGIDQQGPYYVMDYHFDNWADSDDVANQLMGYSVRFGATTVHTSPHSCTLSPNLSCVDCKIEGLGNAVLNSSGLPSYDNGFIAHVTYRGISYLSGGLDPNQQIDPLTPIPWCTQELDWDTQHYEVLNRNLFLAGGFARVATQTIEVGITIYNITYFKLPYIPMTAIRKCRGKVNQGTFMGQPEATILFKGAKTTREYNTDGTVVRRATLIFHEREVSWNKAPDPKLLQASDYSNWKQITDVGGTNSLYNLVDMSGLLVL